MHQIGNRLPQAIYRKYAPRRSWGLISPNESAVNLMIFESLADSFEARHSKMMVVLFALGSANNFLSKIWSFVVWNPIVGILDPSMK